MTTTTLPTVHESDSHAPHVAHHFVSAEQQFNAGKLGMWLFLATEVLFFSGLFVAYAVYRVRHPEVFLDAHKHLNTTLGACNTIVLLLSSLTMAWSVRCAQLGQQKRLVMLLASTLACGSLFLGVKAVEYAHKWGSGLLWAGAIIDQFHVAAADIRHHTRIALACLSLPPLLVSGGLLAAAIIARHNQRSARFWLLLLLVVLPYFLGVGVGQLVEHLTIHGQASLHQTAEQNVASDIPTVAIPANTQSPINYTGVFFSIYYAMTGVHAIHIIAGMGVITWLMWRALRGDFTPDYFGPVDYVGLYWHLVDLIWIYLFPLLYLIR